MILKVVSNEGHLCRPKRLKLGVELKLKDQKSSQLQVVSNKRIRISFGVSISHEKAFVLVHELCDTIYLKNIPANSIQRGCQVQQESPVNLMKTICVRLSVT